MFSDRKNNLLHLHSISILLSFPKKAFRRLFNQLGLAGLPDVDTETLTTILLYHVIAGNVYSNDLRDGRVETLGGSDVQVDVRSSSHRIFFNNAEVITADIKASNGVIHVIDAVLVPPNEPTNPSLPSLLELVSGDSRFNQLVKCLGTAGLVDAVADGKDFTIFAPTNAVSCFQMKRTEWYPMHVV